MTMKMKLVLLGTMAAVATPAVSQANQWSGYSGQDQSWSDHANYGAYDGQGQDQRDYGRDQYRPGPPNYQPGEWFGRHQGYLHAVSDIRTAFWLLAHREPNNPYMAGDEQRAQNELHAAYDELARAQVSDGRSIDDQPPPDMVFGGHRDRLNQAVNLVARASHSLEDEEENPQAYNMRRNAREHLSIASRLIGKTMRDAQY